MSAYKNLTPLKIYMNEAENFPEMVKDEKSIYENKVLIIY